MTQYTLSKQEKDLDQSAYMTLRNLKNQLREIASKPENKQGMWVGQIDTLETSDDVRRFRLLVLSHDEALSAVDRYHQAINDVYAKYAKLYEAFSKPIKERAVAEMQQTVKDVLNLLGQDSHSCTSKKILNQCQQHLSFLSSAEVTLHEIRQFIQGLLQLLGDDYPMSGVLLQPLAEEMEQLLVDEDRLLEKATELGLSSVKWAKLSSTAREKLISLLSSRDKKKGSVLFGQSHTNSDEHDQQESDEHSSGPSRRR